MLEIIWKYKLSLLGAFLGGIAGYFYYKNIGCVSGTCPITSNPYLSVLYGIIVGVLLLNSFEK